MKIKQNLIVSIMNLTTRQSDKSIGPAKEKTFKASCPGEHNTVVFEITNFFQYLETQWSLNYMFYEAEHS